MFLSELLITVHDCAVNQMKIMKQEKRAFFIKQ